MQAVSQESCQSFFTLSQACDEKPPNILVLPSQSQISIDLKVAGLSAGCYMRHSQQTPEAKHNSGPVPLRAPNSAEDCQQTFVSFQQVQFELQVNLVYVIWNLCR